MAEQERSVADLKRQDEVFAQIKQEMQDKMDAIEAEKNTLKDQQFTVEEKFDQNDNTILELKKELQKAYDEIELRKSVNE